MPAANAAEQLTWPRNRAAAFLKSREEYGALSNMTGGFPVIAAGVCFQSSEGLYQALKFPRHPELQRRIAAARSGYEAKRVAYASRTAPLPGWESLKREAMAYALAAKLAGNPERFGAALRETGTLEIVEISYKDPYWGAHPQHSAYIGRNELGKLLMELRDRLLEQGDAAPAAQAFLAGRDLSRFRVNGRELTP